MKKCKKRLAILLLVAVFAANSVASVSAAGASDTYESQSTNTEGARVISHRGYHVSAPENTMPAFEAAKSRGYKYVESDVQFTKDNIPVLCHDSTINRTARKADGSYIPLLKYIKDMGYSELRSYDFGIAAGSEYKGTKIPSFEEWLKFCRLNNIVPYVEIKQQMNADQIKLLFAIACKVGMRDNIVWIAFTKYSSCLKTVVSIDKTAEIGVLAYGIDSISMNLAESLQTGLNRVFLNTNYIAINKLSMARAKQRDFDVEAWTVNNTKTGNSLLSIGVKGITTNTVLPNEVGARISSNEAELIINRFNTAKAEASESDAA